MSLANETEDDDFEISIHFVKPEQMRYDTTDDYVWDNGRLLVFIVNRDSRLDRMAILLHSLAEWAISREEGITIPQIDEWDFAHPDSPEPGSEADCPYGRAHHIAVAVEHTFRILTGAPDEK